MTRRKSVWGRELLWFCKRHRPLLAFSIIFFGGVVLGALLVRTADPATLDAVGKLTGEFSARRAEQGFWQTVGASLLPGLLLLALLFFSGFCAIGQPVIAAVPLFRGLGFGVGAGYLYARHGLIGVGYVAALLLPGAVISALTLLAAASEALWLANGFFGGIRGQAPRPVKPYCVLFAGFAALILFSALADGAANLLFGRWFLSMA
ncbi:MAG: hypothetical protein PHD67_03530 [Oscillospiraceae bacterium]|nr:hypothetical protein [Oscillospiraceae bacterium]